MRPVDLTGRPLGICKVATRYRINPCPTPPPFFHPFFSPIYEFSSSAWPGVDTPTAIFATKTATSARNKLNCDSHERTNGKGGWSLDHRLPLHLKNREKRIVSLSRPRLSTWREPWTLFLIKTERFEAALLLGEEWKDINHLKLSEKNNFNKKLAVDFIKHFPHKDIL